MDATAPQKWTQKIKLTKADIFAIILTLLLAGIPFCYGKYIEFNTPGPFDSAAYVYSAAHILDGAEIGTEEVTSARIGTLLVNMLGVKLFGYSDVGPQVIQMLLQLLALITMFIAVRAVYGRFAATVSTALAAIYLCAPVIAKYGNVKEQYMTAVMIIGAAFLVLYLKKQKFILALLAGFFLAWAPLFKQTGISAPFAAAVLLLTSILSKWTDLKNGLRDIGLVAGGAVLAIAPIAAWILISGVDIPLPYSSYFRILFSYIESSTNTPLIASAIHTLPMLTLTDYISSSRELFGLKDQFPIVMRYYKVLSLPILLATASLVCFVWRRIYFLKPKTMEKSTLADRFPLFLIIWWLLDTAFVWISPRSYEQYYIPLCGSAAFLAAYAIHLYTQKLKNSNNKLPMLAAGLVAIIAAVFLVTPIFIGISTSPHSGQEYKDRYGQPDRQRGYAQKLEEIKLIKQKNLLYPWQYAAQHIQLNSTQDDTIYVWGWIPGIYTHSQRFSSVPRAFISEMHVYSPQVLAGHVSQIVTSFEKQPPKFIVDTRKNHFPWTVPPLVLWPQIPNPQGKNPPTVFLPNQPPIVRVFEQKYKEYLIQNISEEEAQRFDSMKPLRDYVMQNYTPVSNSRFGSQIQVFRRKSNGISQ